MTNYEKLIKSIIGGQITNLTDILTDEPCERCVYKHVRCRELPCEEGVRKWLEQEAKDA